jgi:general secretion pathway protein D
VPAVQRRLSAALLAAALLPVPGPCAAVPPRSSSVTLNFPDTDIDAAARAMAAITGRAVMVDPRVKGKLTLYTDEPVSPARAWALFVGNLRGLGYAVVEAGGLRKVVPEADAKLQAGASPAAGAWRDDTIVTQVIPVLHENAGNLVAVLRPLISPNNTVNVNPGTNTLVITDYASNLARLQTLIAALDTPNATDVEVIPLQHTQAAVLAATVQKLLEGAGGAQAGGNGAAGAGTGPTAPLVLADPSLNALLVRAPNPARLAMVRTLVARLDQPGGASGRVHVLYLQHAEATRLAAVLRAAFPASGDTRAGASALPTASASPVATTGSSASSATAAVGATGSTSAEASSPVTATAQPSTGGYIQADPASNALIITAAEPLWRDLRAVIDQLDQRRAQLYVESLVAEVDASRSRDIGVKWPQILGISESSVSTVTLGTIAEALESQAGSNILSNANVVTLDNEEARIVVGQNVPFVTGSYTTTSGTSSNPFQTIERKDVGITLRIKPQISANGQIRLTIFQESSSVASTSSTTGPTTNKRSIETSVVVEDGKLVVLGGLIEDGWTASHDAVPVLSHVPLLGALFRAESRTRKKNNLVVFLRPRVMRDEAASNRLSIDRYDVLRAEQRALPDDPRDVLVDAPRPALPER